MSALPHSASATSPLPARSVEPSAPYFVVLNAGSGKHDTDERRALIEQTFREAGREHEIRLVDDPRRLKERARDTVRLARERGGVVVVAGGDGTINTVAHAVLGSGCPFGIVPQGTFNYFSRTHGIPSDTAAAVRVLLTARAHPVQVGRVNEHIFLVNASLGLYPQLLEDREAYKRRFGRSRAVALLSAVMTLLRERGQLRLAIEHAGQTVLVRTPTLFVGNNRLQFDQIGIPAEDDLREGRLVAVVLQPVGVPALLWLMVRGAVGTLARADQVDSLPLRHMVVETAGGRAGQRVKVATDGEILSLRTPLEFGVVDQPLFLLKPDPATAPRDGDDAA